MGNIVMSYGQMSAAACAPVPDAFSTCDAEHTQKESTMSITRLHSGPRMSQVVIHGETVYLAGQVGSPGADVADQTRDCLAAIDRLLEEAGSNKSKLLQVTIWLADMADFDAMNAVYDAWIDPENPAARACGEARLATPDYKVEFIVTAAL